jgi:hypothetical protein
MADYITAERAGASQTSGRSSVGVTASDARREGEESVIVTTTCPACTKALSVDVQPDKLAKNSFMSFAPCAECGMMIVITLAVLKPVPKVATPATTVKA